jgi:ubiquinone/menaquinone biosynthesis C-methylase UbiE
MDLRSGDLLQDIIGFYNRYNEEGRLNRDNYHRTEFLITLRLLAPYLKSGSRILDAGAGTGQYSCYYAEQGFTVDALDLTPRHVDKIREKSVQLGLDNRLTAIEGNACDLSVFQDGIFDAVLCMGPLYHLPDHESRLACMNECLRVLKPGGILAAAYVNQAGSYLYSIIRNPSALKEQPPAQVFGLGGGFADGCFTNLDPQKMEHLMSLLPIEKLEHSGTDGISAAVQETVNRMNEEEFNLWLDYLYTVNRESTHLGNSLHSLYVARKQS